MEGIAAFKEGENLFCQHMGKYYECKCLQTRYNKAKELWEYFVHYQGWSKKWDEWAPEERLLKSVPASIRKKEEAELSKKSRKQTRKSKAPTPGKTEPAAADTETPSEPPATPSVSERPRSRAKKIPRATPTPEPSSRNNSKSRDSPPPKVAKKEIKSLVSEGLKSSDDPTSRRTITASDLIGKHETILSKPENIKVVFPAKLERWLTEDWAQLNDTNQPKIINLPAEITVAAILEKYEQYQLQNAPREKHGQIKDNTKTYLRLFELSLPSKLLTKWERQQYADIRVDLVRVPVSQIYGVHHLMRMFSVFSSVLEAIPANSNMSPVKDMFQDFFQFLVLNEGTFFKMDNFVPAPAEYRRTAAL